MLVGWVANLRSAGPAPFLPLSFGFGAATSGYLFVFLSQLPPALRGMASAQERHAALIQKASSLLFGPVIPFSPLRSGGESAGREDTAGYEPLSTLLREWTDSADQVRAHGITVGSGPDALAQLPKTLVVRAIRLLAIDRQLLILSSALASRSGWAGAIGLASVPTRSSGRGGGDGLPTLCRVTHAAGQAGGSSGVFSGST